MNVIKKIGLVGVGPYKSPAVLTVEPGVTVLYGKNNLNDGNGNASGKSVLVSSLADIFYDEPIIGVKQDKSKTGKRFVTFQQGNSKVKVLSAFNKTEKLQILVDGEDKSGRTNTLTRSTLPEYWPVTREEFSTYGYIDASVPHPLARGSSTERKSFFNSFFRLDQMDAEKRVFTKAMLDIKKVKASHTELTRVFNEIKGDMLSKAARATHESTLATLEGELEALIAQQDKAQKVAALLRFEQSLGADLPRVPDDLSEVDSELKAARSNLRKAEASVAQQDEYATFVREARKYRAAVAELDMETPDEVLAQATKDLVRHQALLEALTQIEKPAPLEPVEKPDTDLASLEASQRRLKHALEHSRKFTTGVCGECGQSVKRVDPTKLKAQLKTVEADLSAWVDYLGYGREAEGVENATQAYEKAQLQIRDSKKRIPELKELASLHVKRSRLFKPEKVEQPEVVMDVADCKILVRDLEFAANNKDNLESLRALTKRDRAIKFDDARLAELQAKVYEARTKLEMHNLVKGKATKIRTRLAELSDSIAQEDQLTLILEAYNDKAMKKMAIEAISRQLMMSVNRYSSLVFDNYHFEFVWGSQIQILVYRGKEPPTDVRKLSGAESMLFTLILVLSLLVFVPKSRRLSLLILDEPTASFSEGTIELFHKLLPHVTQVIPSVIVVTPKAQIRLDGAHEVTVVRDKDGARLVKGHPDDV